MYMLRKGFAMTYRKQRDPYTLKLLTQREKVKGTEQDRERDKQTQTPNSFFKLAATGAPCFLATKKRKTSDLKIT